MPKISIIIPIYNSEKTLNKCLDSVLEQTIKDLEIILVNDGSQDRSEAICNTYQQKDSRISIITKENSGQGDARNCGLAVAKGDFIGFVDSDDYVELDMFELLYKNALKEDADISCCRIICEKNHLLLGYGPLPDKEYYKTFAVNEKTITMFYQGEYYVAGLVNKLFKRAVFNEVRCIPGSTYEDDYLFFPILEHAKNVVVDSACKYHYVYNEKSTMNRSFRMSELELIKVGKLNLQIVRARYRGAIPYAEARVWDFQRRVMDKLLQIKQPTSEETMVLKNLKLDLSKARLSIVRNKYLGIKGKLIYLILGINITIYEFLLQTKRTMSLLGKKQ